MFTGIVEEVGHIKAIRKQGSALQLEIECQVVHHDVQLGDSIAVNGVCLTVTAAKHKHLHFDVVPETFRRTSLSQLHPGSPVNLERAMAANGRYGGHIVSGHVDAIGTIRSMKKEDNAVIVEVGVNPRDMLKYMVERGSVTLDGISLTLNHVSEHTLTVSIIPHTFAQTVLNYKKPDDLVNIEVDIIAKYVERLLTFQSPGDSSRYTHGQHAGKGKIDMEFLSGHGFLGG